MVFKEGEIVVIKGDPTQLYLVWTDFNIYKFNIEDSTKDNGVAVVKFPQTVNHTNYEFILPRRCVRLATRTEISLYG